MTSENLLELIEKVVKSRAEYQYVELKAAKKGCPEKLYDSLSSFSNRDDGGIIIFGVDEKNDFDMCGVYDLQDIQQKITEQCDSMTPKVRPLFSYAQKDDKNFCSIEVPALDIADRPCYYSGKGRLKGSYVRVGTNDEPMTEYEIYSYEAYRKKYQDDIRVIERVTNQGIDERALNEYIKLLTENKPKFVQTSKRANLRADEHYRQREIYISYHHPLWTLSSGIFSAVVYYCNRDSRYRNRRNWKR